MRIVVSAWFPSISPANCWQRRVPPISIALPELPAERERSPYRAVPRPSPHTRSAGCGIRGNPKGAQPPPEKSPRHQTARKRIPPLQHNSFLAPRCVAGRVPDAPQLLPRSKQSRLHRTHRNLKNLRQFRVRLAFDFAQPQKRPLLLSQACEGISNCRKTRCPLSGFFSPAFAFFGSPCPLSPPFRRSLPPNPEKVSSERPQLRPKAVRRPPNLRERLLHYILCSLSVADNLPQISAKPRGIAMIERLEGVRIAATNPFPKLVVVRHAHSSYRYSSESQEMFADTRIFLAHIGPKN